MKKLILVILLFTAVNVIEIVTEIIVDSRTENLETTERDCKS